MDFLVPKKSFRSTFSRSGSFSDSSAVAVYCRSVPKPLSLESYLDRPFSPEFDSKHTIIIVPRAYGSQEKLDTVQVGFDYLTSLWKVPPAAIKPLFAPDWVFVGHYTQSFENVNHSWFSLPIVYIDKGNVWSSGYERFSLSISESAVHPYVRVLIIAVEPMRRQLEFLVKTYQRDFARKLGTHSAIFYLQIMLIERSLASIQSFWKEWYIGTGSLVAVMQEVLNAAINDDWLLKCHTQIEHGENHVKYLDNLKEVTTQLMNNCTKIDSTLTAPNNSSLQQALAALQQRIVDDQDLFNNDISLLQSRRDEIHRIVRLRIDQDILNHTIAHRQLAEQNEQGRRHIKALAEASRKDAKDMRKLAYLTMFYLPGTFLAVVFSTPFFEMGPEGTFSENINKLWILFTISGVLTLMTFAVSWAWDHLHYFKSLVCGASNWRTAGVYGHPLPQAATPDRSVFESPPEGPGLNLTTARHYRECYDKSENNSKIRAKHFMPLHSTERQRLTGTYLDKGNSVRSSIARYTPRNLASAWASGTQSFSTYPPYPRSNKNQDNSIDTKSYGAVHHSAGPEIPRPPNSISVRASGIQPFDTYPPYPRSSKNQDNSVDTKAYGAVHHSSGPEIPRPPNSLSVRASGIQPFDAYPPYPGPGNRTCHRRRKQPQSLRPPMGTERCLDPE